MVVASWSSANGCPAVDIKTSAPQKARARSRLRLNQPPLLPLHHKRLGCARIRREGGGDETVRQPGGQKKGMKRMDTWAGEDGRPKTDTSVRRRRWGEDDAGADIN